MLRRSVEIPCSYRLIFVPRKDYPVVFDFIEEALNQMALFVNKPVALAGLGPAATRRDDRLHAPFLDGLHERIGVIALVADKGIGTCRSQCQQSLGLTDVAALSAGQHELQWVSQGIGDGACCRRPKTDPVCRLKNDPGTKAVF